MALTLWAAIAMVLIAAAGAPISASFRVRGALFIGCSWLFGCGAIGVGLVCLSALHVPFGRLSLAATWLAVFAIGICCAAVTRQYLSDFDKSNRQSFLDSTNPVVLLLIAVCVLQLTYVCLVAVRVPLASFDSWSLWDYKGRTIWMAQGLTGTSVVNNAAIFAHPAYPPLLPLLISWTYTWTGSGDPVYMKPLFPVFYAALLFVFYGGLKQRRSSRVALLATACLALVPRVADYAGTGLADVPMAAFVTAGAALCMSAQIANARQHWIAGGAMLGLSACIKHDGLVYVGTAIGMMALIRARPSAFARLTGATLLVAVPWYLYVAFRHAPDRDFHSATIANLTHFAGRIPGIARLFTLNLLATNEWSILWIATVALTIRALWRGALSGAIMVVPVVIPICFYVVSLSLSAWPDYVLHVRTSLDRLILVTAPFAIWFIFDQAMEIARSRAWVSGDSG
jgi:hypothetical protein